MQRVSEYLERQPDEVPVTAIYRDVKGKRDYLIEAVAFLVGDGWANERAGERGSRLIRVAKPYREPSPTRPHPSPDAGIPPVPAVPPPLGGDGDGNPEDDEEGRWESLLEILPEGDEHADFEQPELDEATL